MKVGLEVDYVRGREEEPLALVKIFGERPRSFDCDFDRARELLRGAGYDTVTVFERRSPRQGPLG